MQNNNIKKILKFVFATFFLVAIIMTPVFFVFAAPLVPCGINEIEPYSRDCTITDIFTLINNIIKFLLFTVAIPLAAIGFAWAGWLYLTAGGNSGQIEKAHDIFKGIFIGLAIALAAWLIVSAILSGLGVEGERGAFNLLK